MSPSSLFLSPPPPLPSASPSSSLLPSSLPPLLLSSPLPSLLPPGAQIIDLMMLVVDITKGIQTQTAEVSYYSNSKVLRMN